MGIFGNKGEKTAEDAAASKEFERLTALPRPDLAAEIMPVFGPDGPEPSRGNPGLHILEILTWTMRSEPRGGKYAPKLQQPVLDALQLLTNAGLVADAGRGKVSGTTYRRATPLGETALADGSIRQHLLGAASG